MLTELVQFLRIQNCPMSEPISRGWFSSASGHCPNWSNAVGVEVCVLPLVLPSETVELPHVPPALAAGVPERAALEAVTIPVGGHLRRGRRAEQTAQVDDVLLRCGVLLQLRGLRLRNELVGSQRAPRVERLLPITLFNFTARPEICPCSPDARVFCHELPGGRKPSLKVQFL